MRDEYSDHQYSRLEAPKRKLRTKVYASYIAPSPLFMFCLRDRMKALGSRLRLSRRSRRSARRATAAAESGGQCRACGLRGDPLEQSAATRAFGPRARPAAPLLRRARCLLSHAIRSREPPRAAPQRRFYCNRFTDCNEYQHEALAHTGCSQI